MAYLISSVILYQYCPKSDTSESSLSTSMIAPQTNGIALGSDILAAMKTLIGRRKLDESMIEEVVQDEADE